MLQPVSGGMEYSNKNNYYGLRFDKRSKTKSICQWRSIVIRVQSSKSSETSTFYNSRTFLRVFPSGYWSPHVPLVRIFNRRKLPRMKGYATHKSVVFPESYSTRVYSNSFQVKWRWLPLRLTINVSGIKTILIV